jgi:uncharacterized alpha-E superfamily protein
MLSSTADHLYWMARSMERAENTARMLDVTYRMSLLKQAVDQRPARRFRGALRRAQRRQCHALHGTRREESRQHLQQHFHRARKRPRRARLDHLGNVGGAQRTWLEMRGIHAEGIAENGVSPFFEWVKERSHLSRGITHGTLLRDDTYRFLRLGTFFERADNTARILDVKYHILLPSLSEVGGAADYYQWGALLRSVSAFESYRKVYRDQITPKRVAELLILRPTCRVR